MKFLTAAALMGFAMGLGDPVADEKAMVKLGKARFTVLTDRLIRIEWAKTEGVFEDAASATFINRKLSVPEFRSEVGADSVVINTDYLSLAYKPGDAGLSAFNATNLAITFKLNGEEKVWTPGTEDTGNLLGTFRTLDSMEGWQELDCKKNSRAQDLHCNYGILSKDGWTLQEDTAKLLDQGEPIQWLLDRDSNDESDWYFFGHGHDYKQAIYDFTLVAGKVPIPPRYAFGIYFSRWWGFNDRGSKNIVKEYVAHNTPLDVLVTDMDWHITFYREMHSGTTDQAGQSKGWTGLTWDSHLFPAPSNFMAWCKKKGLRNTLNLHPASGVQPHEAAYEEMATAMGIDPTTQVYVPYNLTDKKFASNYLDIVLKPVIDDGVDFWWLDWQQWMDGMPSPTFWLNHVIFNMNKHYNRNLRGMLLHRWGGLGNHRYQMGFSGDVIPSWNSLSFQPYFTMTAANVLFGYWSHDLGGHTAPVEAELYTRWVQWGALSPMFRTHCTKDASNDRRIWIFSDEYFMPMRAAHQFRSQLVPYLYSAAFDTYETGIAGLHPLYYEYPDVEEAYTLYQYMFGNKMMAAPVVAAGDSVTKLTEQTIWIPEGRWIEYGTTHIFEGPTTITRKYDLDEIPLFIKAGSIITMLTEDRPLLGSAQRQYTSLLLEIFPTPTDSGLETVLYEDDGLSEDYLEGVYATQKMRYEMVSTSEMIVTIDAVEGTFDGLPEAREYTIKLNGVAPASAVEINGVAVPAENIEFEGNEMSLTITTGSIATNSRAEVHIVFTQPIRDYGNYGRCMSRLEKVKEILDQQWGKNIYPEDYYNLLDTVETGERISANPETLTAEYEAFAAALAGSLTTMQNYSYLEEAIRNRIVALLESC